jgi:S-(hydroxymethyl)glutathione dehydrogenase/alcohol dehydrogenase
MLGTGVVADGNGSFSVESINVEEPGQGEVLIEMKAAGVCHTDADGVDRWCTAPTVLGHEGAGVVAGVGPGVTDLSVGTPVLLTWTIACGHCFQCVTGEPTLCEVLGREHGHAHVGSTASTAGDPIDRYFNLGTMSTASVVRREAVVPLPLDMPLTSACLLGCAVMTGYGSVVNAARVRAGSTVAVIGCGGVGLNVIQAARIAGARRIVAIDINAARFDLAATMGATDFLQPEAEDTALRGLTSELVKMGDGRACDYAFECTGNPLLGAAPLTCVRNGGTAVQVSGIEEEISIDMTLFEWDKIYLNPLYGKCRPTVDFPILVDLYKRGLLLLDELVSRTYPLSDLDRAFADMRAGHNAKGVLVI